MESTYEQAFNSILVSDSIGDIVSRDYEFSLIIDSRTGICKIISRHEKDEIPFLLDEDYSSYKDQLDSFLANSIAPAFRKEAQGKMSFSAILKKTEDGRQYAVTFPVIYPRRKDKI